MVENKNLILNILKFILLRLKRLDFVAKSPDVRSREQGVLTLYAA